MFLKKCSFAIRVWFGLTPPPPPPVMVKDHIFTKKELDPSLIRSIKNFFKSPGSWHECRLIYGLHFVYSFFLSFIQKKVFLVSNKFSSQVSGIFWPFWPQELEVGGCRPLYLLVQYISPQISGQAKSLYHWCRLLFWLDISQVFRKTKNIREGLKKKSWLLTNLAGPPHPLPPSWHS